MGMKFKKSEKILRNLLEKKYPFTLEVTEEDNHLTVKTYINIKDIADNILMRVEVYANGGLYTEYVFDKIDKTTESLEKLFNYNAFSPFMKAEITSTGYLKIGSAVACATEKTLENIVDITLTELVSDEIKPYLSALTQLTYIEEN